MVTLSINGVPVDMELDSGSPVSLMPKTSFERLFKSTELRESDIQLATYTGESLNVCGYLPVVVKYESQSHSLKLYVVNSGHSTLLGRDWLQKIKLNWKNIKFIQSIKAQQPVGNLNQLKNEFVHLFDDKLGKLVDFQAKLQIKDNAAPVFMRARAIPYAMREKVEQELNRLEKEGVVSKTNTSEWATPIVPILKKNNRVRICGDYKVTVNPALKVDRYPQPKPRDIFAALAGGVKFTKLDLRQAYLQCEVDDATKELLTLNTHKGLYKMNRLAFGIASSPAIWQRKMEQILQGLPFCYCILDDILVTGRDDLEHLQVLRHVFERLSANGLQLNKDKCSFLQDEVEYTVLWSHSN